MTNSKKPLEVIFAPGCFDHLDVADQAELDAVVKEITEMFANITPEELAAHSLDVDMDQLDDNARLILEQSFGDIPRNLQ